MEEWRDIIGYDGLYQISNLGRVKSLSRLVPHWKGGQSLLKETIRKTNVNGNGYIVVQLHNDGVKATHEVHRLIAEAFIPNPNNYPTVMFRNGNRTDLTLSNLFWTNNSDKNFHTNYLKRDKMDNFIIEKDIPIPQKELKQKYPYNLMEIGDSFAVQTTDNKWITRLQTSAVQYRRRFNNTRKFKVMRVNENEIRCWRIE